MDTDIGVRRIMIFKFVILIRQKEKKYINVLGFFLGGEEVVVSLPYSTNLENLSILNFECGMNNPSCMLKVQTCIAEMCMLTYT